MLPSTSQSLRIIGIDPGLRATGWGIIETQGSHIRHIANGTIKTTDSHALPLRLLKLNQELAKIITQHSPHGAAIEKTFVNSNAASSLKLSHARGVLMVTLAQADLIAEEYDPTKIKKAIVGNGRADKSQISAMLAILLPQATPDSADAADALAIAICHAHHLPIKQQIA